MSISREADDLSLAFGCLLNNIAGTLGNNIFWNEGMTVGVFKIEVLR
jgi:hypothetical protein